MRNPAKGGTRKDLGLYVRSSWEANYARYLDWLRKNGAIYSWAYEPKIFRFPGIQRGCIDYKPDFAVKDHKDGPTVWHEVKGYMDQRSRTKLKRMAKYFPDEKIILIQKKDMMQIKNKVGALLNWE